MSAQLLSMLNQHGPWIVFFCVLVDQMGLPVPAIPVLVGAGTLAAAGRLSAPQLFVLACAACLFADLAWFAIGRSYGMRVLKTLCRISLEADSCVSDTQLRFQRWGVNSLIFAKFIPGLAVIAPPLAGALRMGWLRFTLLSAIGAALWVAAGIGAGMIFNAQIDALFAWLAPIGNEALMGVVLLLFVYIGFKWWERRRFLAKLRMARISVGDLHDLMESGAGPIVVDVRTHTARQHEPQWIPSAIHAPVDQMEARVRDLPRDRDIVVYCTCPNEASAASVARRLMSHGFSRVRPLSGGLDAWIGAGYPVETAAPTGAGTAGNP